MRNETFCWPPYLALEAGAVRFVRIVTTIVIMVALPTARNTFAVTATELGLGTISVTAATHFLSLVTSVPTVILKVAQPTSETNHILVSHFSWKN
jgi:hypothetical protein